MRSKKLKQLQAAIAAIEGGWGAGGTDSGPPKGGESSVRAGDNRTGGTDSERSESSVRMEVPPVLHLARGFHEWFGLADAGTPRWVPPLGILLHLAGRRIEGAGSGAGDGAGDGNGNGGGVVWIGRRCWPYMNALGPAEARSLLRQSVFIDPPDDAGRLWSIDLAARCPAVAAVVADGSGLDMAATRRLQLAAEAGSAPVVCARPPGELKRLSAASTRWLVRCAPSETRNPRWIVQLLRCKGAMQPKPELAVEWKRVKGSVVVHAAFLDRSHPAAPEARRSA